MTSEHIPESSEGESHPCKYLRKVWSEWRKGESGANILGWKLILPLPSRTGPQCGKGCSQLDSSGEITGKVRCWVIPKCVGKVVGATFLEPNTAQQSQPDSTYLLSEKKRMKTQLHIVFNSAINKDVGRTN